MFQSAQDCTGGLSFLAGQNQVRENKKKKKLNIWNKKRRRYKNKFGNS
jgi:hypothetical protein